MKDTPRCPVCGRLPSPVTDWCSGSNKKRHAAVNVVARAKVQRVGPKQAEILKWLHVEREQADEENDPERGAYTTFDLFELITQVQTEDPGFKGWDRGSLAVALTRMEERGLVRRLPVTEHHLRGVIGPHWNRISGVASDPGRRKARFAWQITGAGFRALEATWTATEGPRDV